MTTFAQRFPLRSTKDGRELCDDATAAYWVSVFFWIGLTARAVRYLLCFPLWEDECFLSVNLIDRGYGELMQPLDSHQVAPLLFLWVQRLVVDLLGFNEWALRLFSFVSGVGSLLLFRRLVTRLLSGGAQVMAFAAFAAAYPCVRYSAEAKPYGSDLFAALLMTVLAIEWLRDPRRTAWLWASAALAPAAIGLSYPAAFVGGGLSLFLGRELWLQPNRAAFRAWVALNVALVGSFVAFYLLTISAQAGAEHAFMGDFWKAAFPPLGDLRHLPWWLIDTHSGAMLAYPAGGGRGLSSATLIAVVVAAATLVRRRRFDVLWFGICPFALNFLAAALHKYPYGGHVKLAFYGAAWICLAGGFGAAVILQQFGRLSARPQQLVFRWALSAVLLVAVGTVARDVAKPCKSQSDQRQRDFARWFWFSYPAAGELTLADFETDPTVGGVRCTNLTTRAMFLCNRAIYAPRAPQRPPADEHLRCVAYRDLLFPSDPEVERRWLGRMEADYRLVRRESFPLPHLHRDDPRFTTPNVVDYFEFEPRTPAAQAAAPADASNR